MVLRSDQQQIKALLTETMILLCKDGLNFSSELTVEGLFGITIDQKEVLLININETIKVPASTDFMDINQMPGLDTYVENCVVEKEGSVFNRKGNHSLIASGHLDADSYLLGKNIEETAVSNNCAELLSNRHCSISSLDEFSVKTRRKAVYQNYKSSEPYSHSDGARTRCTDASSLKPMGCSAVVNNRHFSSPCCQRQSRLDDVVHVPTFCVENVSTDEHLSPETNLKPDCSPDVNSSSNDTRQACDSQAEYIKLEYSNDAQLFSHQSAGVSDDGSQGAAAQSTVCPKEGIKIDEGQSPMNDLKVEFMPGVGEVELVPGFGVFVSQRFFRQYCRDGQFTLNGSQLVRRLVRELFPDDGVIAASSCCGNKNKRTSSFALDRQKIEAIKGTESHCMVQSSCTYIAQACHNLKLCEQLTNFVETCEDNFGESRRILNPVHRVCHTDRPRAKIVTKNSGRHLNCNLDKETRQQDKLKVSNGIVFVNPKGVLSFHRL